MLLATPYLYAAAICITIVKDGGPGWLYPLVLLSVWNAFKFFWIGHVGLVHLVRAAQVPGTCRSLPIRSDTPAGFFDLTPAPLG